MKRRITQSVAPQLVLLFVCLIAYLPLSSFLFALKNDAFIYNFPNKFFFSETLRSGHIPLWNPYLNFGFPLYADPGFAWWHPLTWLFGMIGYNAYTFTIEVLLYIYLSGLGMYWLIKKLGLNCKTALAAGCMYMCSGFFIGNLQHINFLTGAAFLPWLVGAWLQYQQTPSVKTRIFCGLAIYLICASGHPAVPIGTIYFFLCVTLLHYFFYRGQQHLKPYLLRQLKLFGVVALLLLPLIFSYSILLPFYTRALPAAQAASLDAGFTLSSFISFLLPFGTVKDQAWFGTDVSMRNAYFSIAGFILLLQFLIQKNKTVVQRIFLIAGLLLLLLSFGGGIKKYLFQVLPLLQYIRTNGEFRVFTILSFIVCIAFGMDALMQGNKHFILMAVKWLYRFSIALAILAVALLFFYSWENLIPISGTSIPARIKFIIDHLSLAQSLMIATVVALVLMRLYVYGLRKSSLVFVAIIIGDMIVNSWLLLPVTGVSQTSVAKMQAIIIKSPDGIPLDLIQDTTVQKPVTADEERLIGNWNWYGKTINYSTPVDYPSLLKSTDRFLQSAATGLIAAKPALFFKKGNGTIILKSFTPNGFDAAVRLTSTDTLVFLQNKYPGWEAWVNEKAVPLQPYLNTFMQLPVDEKTKQIRLQFSMF